MTELDRATVDHLLSTTRAVRKRLDLTRPVPRDVILECLRLATQAPSGSNRQLWRWLVIEDPEVRAALGELYRMPPPPGLYPQPVVSATQAARMRDSTSYLRDHLHEVPVLVVPCTEDSGGAAGWQPSMYPAVWSFMLALRSRGLGSCITTNHLNHAQDAAEILGIPDGYVQACLLPVAYFTGDDFRPATRRPVEEVTYWNHWGSTA